MVSRFYRDRLQQVLASAQDDDVATASNNWYYYASWIDTVSQGIRKNGKNLASEIEGQSGEAMVAKFRIIADKLDAESADMTKGSTALGLAQGAMLEAIKTHNGIRLSGPMNQPPTKPEGPLPGQQPTPEQTTALGNYNTGMATYLQNEQMYEDNARKALEAMDQEYAAADPRDEGDPRRAGPHGGRAPARVDAGTAFRPADPPRRPRPGLPARRARPSRATPTVLATPTRRCRRRTSTRRHRRRTRRRRTRRTRRRRTRSTTRRTTRPRSRATSPAPTWPVAPTVATSTPPARRPPARPRAAPPAAVVAASVAPGWLPAVWPVARPVRRACGARLRPPRCAAQASRASVPRRVPPVRAR